MIKRFYRSCITVKYALPKFLLAIAVFILAYFAFRTKNNLFYYGGCAAGAALIIIMVVEYFHKKRVVKGLKEIQNIEDYYQEGALLGRTFVLEERMLVADEKLQIVEIPATSITNLTIETMPKGREKAVLVQNGNTYTFVMDNAIQAERLAAFLAKKNKDMVIEGIRPQGEGSLSALKKD